MSDYEIISRYSDAQALDDGCLVALNRRDRATGTIMAWLEDHLPTGAAPPSCWPVDMMGWFAGKTPQARAKAAADGLVAQWGPIAKRAPGARLSLYALTSGAGGWIASLESAPPEDARSGVQRFILAVNECDGVTLMLPEDD
jgi:hypothetical protein